LCKSFAQVRLGLAIDDALYFSCHIPQYQELHALLCPDGVDPSGQVNNLSDVVVELFDSKHV
jgi:hypothetical protein